MSQRRVNHQLVATFVYPTGGREAVESATKILAGGSVPRQIRLLTGRIMRDNAGR